MTTAEGKIFRLIEESRTELASIILRRISNNEKLQTADKVLLHVAREIQLILKESEPDKNFDTNGRAI
jgi:hypothetical protein